MCKLMVNLLQSIATFVVLPSDVFQERGMRLQFYCKVGIIRNWQFQMDSRTQSHGLQGKRYMLFNTQIYKFTLNDMSNLHLIISFVSFLCGEHICVCVCFTVHSELSIVGSLTSRHQGQRAAGGEHLIYLTPTLDRKESKSEYSFHLTK